MLSKVKYIVFGITFVIFILFSINLDYDALFISISRVNLYSFMLYFCIILALIISFYEKITIKYPETKKGLLYISICTFFSFIAIFFIFELSDKDYQTSIALLISTLFLGIGWWVQAITTQTAQRRAHTVSIIMNQRNNPDFIEKVRICREIFGTDKIVNKELVKYYFDKESIKINESLLSTSNQNDKKEEFDRIISGLESLNYLVNYYEFIAAGVNSKDLDKELIVKCFSGILISLEVRAFYFIYNALEKDNYLNSDNYPCKELITLINEISNGKSLIVQAKKNNRPVGLDKYKPFLSDNKIKDFFNL